MANYKKLIFTKNEEKFIRSNEEVIYAGYWSSNSIELKKKRLFKMCLVFLTQKK